MSGVTVDPEELKQAADYQKQAAAEADKGVQATSNVDLCAKLYETHGPISGPSNDATDRQAGVSEQAGRTLQQACLTLSAALTTAAGTYTGTDSNSAENLDNQMPSGSI